MSMPNIELVPCKKMLEAANEGDKLVEIRKQVDWITEAFRPAETFLGPGDIFHGRQNNFNIAFREES